MKKLITLTLSISLFLACNKEKSEQPSRYLDAITAGDTSGIGIQYSGVIDHSITYNFLPNAYEDWSIDINEDGKDDFQLIVTGNAGRLSHHGVYSIKALENSFVAVSNNNDVLTDTISLSDTIDNGLSWAESTETILYDILSIYNTNANPPQTEITDEGLWNEVEDKYVGIKTIVDNQEFFGWIQLRIKHSVKGDFILMNYACTKAY